MNSLPFQVLTWLIVSKPYARQMSISPDATDFHPSWKQMPPVAPPPSTRCPGLGQSPR